MSDDASDHPLDEPRPDEAPDERTATRAGFVLVSTPIGNLGDMAPRAREALRTADLVLCEDTLHTARLL
jgi:16S rRNA (cytidine1402-2'-O)-methyltransferase